MSNIHRLDAQALQFMPEASNGSCHIFVPSGDKLQVHAEDTQFIGKVDLSSKARFVEFDDYQGNPIMSVDPDTPQELSFDSNMTLKFNGCTVSGLTGVGSGAVNAQAVASNNTNPASGSAYATVDSELDDIQTRVSANTSRTTGLTASKILVSNGAGVLSAGSFDQTDIMRKSVSGGQTLSSGLIVGGDVNIPDGSAYQVNGVALSSSNLTDSATLSKLASNETLSGDKTFSGDVSMLGSNAVVMNRAVNIQQFDVFGGAPVSGTGVEYTTQQGCIKKTDAVVLTNSKYTDNAVGEANKTIAHGFLRVSDSTTGEVVNTGEVCMADGSLTQTIGGNKTFSSSLTVGSGSSNAFISAGGYLQLTTPSGTNGEIKFNKNGSVHTLTMNDVGTSADNLSFDANFNLTSGNNFKIDGAQLQTNNLSDGALIQKENSADMKLTDTTYKQFASDATSMTGGNGFLQVVEETSGLVRNNVQVVRADGGVVQSIDGAKTFTAPLTVQSNASNFTQIGTTGIISLGNSGDNCGLHFGSTPLTLLETGNSLKLSSAHMNIGSGFNYLINDVQITTGALSDNNVIVKNNQSNTFSSAQTLNGSAIFGVSGSNASQATFGESGATQFSLGKTTATSNSLDLHTDNTSADISVSFGTGSGLTIPMRITDDTVEVSSGGDTATSMRYKSSSYAGSADTSVPNEVVTRADVNAFLSSATTQNSVKANILEFGGGTGFDGSSTSLTINHLNPVVIKAIKHVPDGSGGFSQHPASTANTFQVQCLCQCENGLTVSGSAQNFLARGGVTNGESIADVQVAINQLLTRSPTSWAPDFIDIGVNGSGATVEMTAGLAISIQPTIIRTRHGTNGSGTPIYRVEMRGRIQKSSGNFTTATTLFTAPSGYTSSQEINVICQGHTGVAQVRVDIATNGNVTLITDGSDTVSFVNLTNVSYWTV